MFDKIMSINPWIEVLIKWFYWKSSRLRKIFQPILKKIRSSNSAKSTASGNLEDLKLLFDEFKINNDDILLIHSSFLALRLGSTTPEQLLDYILNEVIPHGTLVLPSMPIMKYVDGGVAAYPGDPDRVAVFDLKKSPPWTGLLPRKLIQYPNSIRWFNPINNVVACGHHAEEMMSNNFLKSSDQEIFPSGEGSPWEYMVRKNAKILSLGTDLTHSLTMIHYVEDIKGQRWPIHNWYRKRKIIIRHNGESYYMELNERNPRWAINFAERTLQKDLLKAGLLKSKSFNGAKVELISAFDLVSFLNDRNTRGYPYFTLNAKL